MSGRTFIFSCLSWLKTSLTAKSWGRKLLWMVLLKLGSVCISTGTEYFRVVSYPWRTLAVAPIYIPTLGYPLFQNTLFLYNFPKHCTCRLSSHMITTNWECDMAWLFPLAVTRQTINMTPIIDHFCGNQIDPKHFPGHRLTAFRCDLRRFSSYVCVHNRCDELESCRLSRPSDPPFFKYI